MGFMDSILNPPNRVPELQRAYQAPSKYFIFQRTPKDRFFFALYSISAIGGLGYSLYGLVNMALGQVRIGTLPVMQAAISGAGSMFLLQIFSKAITFICNQYILRQVSPEIFGTANIQLELLVATLLFLAREPIRLATLRVNLVSEHNDKPDLLTMQKLVNVAWLPALLGLPFATLLVLYYSTSMDSTLPMYQYAVKLYAFGGILDLVSEPFSLICFALMRFKSRAVVEGSALFIQCMSTLVLIQVLGPNVSVFGFARIGFGLTFVLGFMFVAKIALSAEKIPFSIMIPRRVTVTVKDNKQTYFLDPEIISVAISFFKQSLVKHVLTEGDKIILSMFYTPYHQGVYAVIFNYGSTVVRVVFWPIEEAARLLFSRMPESDHRTKARALIELGIKFYMTLGLFSIVFGSQYAKPLMLILAGDQWASTSTGWSSAPYALAAYCYFIPVLGINGITEAFVATVVTAADISVQSMWLVLGGLVFAFVSYVLYPLGATGLVIANCIHLFVRVFWSLRFIKAKFGHRSLLEKSVRISSNLGVSWFESAVPKRSVMMSMIFVYMVAGWTRGAFSEYSEYYAALQYLATGVGIASLAFFLLLMKDLPFVMAIWDLVTNGHIMV